MLQLVFGAALGCIVAQCALHCLGLIAARLRCTDSRVQLQRLLAAPRLSLLGGLSKYAGLAAAAVAVIALAAWSLEDYLKSKSAHAAAPAAADSSAAMSEADGSVDDLPGSATAGSGPPGAGAPAAAVDPYSDADFKVKRQSRRAGAALSLKDTLLERSEGRARADLLSETTQHLHRSQYDCETAVHAEQYLKAGLDVWGFAAWQSKYFPTAGYKGATLPQCKDVKEVLDPSALSAQSGVASDSHS
ncbi:MAG: hypothetical protein JO173_02220 [Gammaproteobacteria bacterium]|nr:hypothetical protein [Gammaproteobacteria bacterium]